LAYPTQTDKFVIDVDSSNVGTGAVLSQIQNGQEKVIAYYSKCFSKQERGYCVTRKELNGVVLAIKHWHHYLYGQEFTVRTDHASLKWLMNFKDLDGQLCRWLNVLSNYNYKIVYRPGKLHSNCDALSRRPCYDSNCLYCERVESRFMEQNKTCARISTHLKPNVTKSSDDSKTNEFILHSVKSFSETKLLPLI